MPHLWQRLRQRYTRCYAHSSASFLAIHQWPTATAALSSAAGAEGASTTKKPLVSRRKHGLTTALSHPSSRLMRKTPFHAARVTRFGHDVSMSAAAMHSTDQFPRWHFCRPERRSKTSDPRDGPASPSADANIPPTIRDPVTRAWSLQPGRFFRRPSVLLETPCLLHRIPPRRATKLALADRDRLVTQMVVVQLAEQGTTIALVRDWLAPTLVARESGAKVTSPASPQSFSPPRPVEQQARLGEPPLLPCACRCFCQASRAFPRPA